MASNSNISMLSDELKPRRTPVPASFQDIIPRPSVPDLSIIESQINIPVSKSAVPPQQTHLDHLSYNDWRHKIGSGVFRGAGGDNYNQPQGVFQRGFSTPSSFNANGQRRDAAKIQRPAVDIVMPSATLTTYSDLSKRPTSAPEDRSARTDYGATRDHPLSKSAPARRTQPISNGMPINTVEQYRSSALCPGSFTSQQQLGSAFVNQSSHERGPHPTASSQAGSMHPACASAGQSRQSIALRSQINCLNEKECQRHEPLFPSSSSEVHVNSYENLSHSGRDARSKSCSEDFTQCHSLRKTDNICSCAHQPCCSSAYTFRPHHGGHHAHALPPCTFQNTTPPSLASYDELYKLVLTQNEQLRLLQAQVEQLLTLKGLPLEHSNPLQAQVPLEKVTPSNVKQGSQLVSEEATQTSECELDEDDCQKMSIGVMTSFIHAVAYRGRMGRRDAGHNMSEHENIFSATGNCSKQSKSHSSDDSSSASHSPISKSSVSQKKKQRTQANCCQDFAPSDKHDENSRKPTKRNEKLRTPCSQLKDAPSNVRKSPESAVVCREGCTCRDSGVTAAISAVRGCQAVLESRTGVGVHEFSTFNGADLPTVTEQPVSPMSSIRVDLHDYNSSSDEESCSSHSVDNISSDDEKYVTDKDHDPALKHNGWTFYNNMLGQVNKILEEREVAGSSTEAHQLVAVQPPKLTDLSVSKRVAFEGNKESEAPKNLKELALKYLKENYPEELASTTAVSKTKTSSKDNPQDIAVYNTPASNMSFATFRYLERYNLLPENFNPQQYLEAAANFQMFHGNSQESLSTPPKKHWKKGSSKQPKSSSGKKIKPSYQRGKPSGGDPHQQMQLLMNNHHKAMDPSIPAHQIPMRQVKANTPTSKILDITTLRQQPKLL